jgi:Mrp family chromosome partitioning ATPase/capsular polysaccharide biosynthesis protein
MELSFVIAALKRRLWVVLVFAQLGALPFIFGSNPASEQTVYESEALISVLPPDDARTAGAQPDRYVLSQIEVLSSPELSGEVAELLGIPDGGGLVRRNTTIAQVTDTDVVSVTVRLGDAEQAREVAQAVADVYLDRLAAQVEATRLPDLDRYNSELITLRGQLESINARLLEIMQPYLNALAVTGGAVPQPSTVAPNEVAEQGFIIDEIRRVELQRSTLQNQASPINTNIVQNATLPQNPVQQSAGIFNVAFLIAMTLLGITIALVWARLSPKLLDELHAAEVLGIPVVAKIKRSKALKQDPLVAFHRLPQDLINSVDQIAVQAEALAVIDRPLTIAVVGAQRGAGTTTTAAALAARFAAAEYSVLLVDADRRDPWISDVMASTEHGGLPALIGLTPVGADRIFSRTSEPDVRVLGLAGNGAALRRETVPLLVERTREAANVVIFDGGPLLDAASSVELTNLVDAVVLTIPLSEARIDDLTVVTRQLGAVDHRVLPVLTGPSGGAATRQPVASDLGADSKDRDGGLVTPSRAADEPVTRSRRAARKESTSDGSERLPAASSGETESLAEAISGADVTPAPTKSTRSRVRAAQSQTGSNGPRSGSKPGEKQ